MSKKAEKKQTVYVYLGATIRGLIQNGSVIKAEDIEKYSKYPAVARLIVEPSAIAEVKAKIRNGGNLYAIAYQKTVEYK